jgi:alkanesulfonate monooxygenase SsuD/methylene tetrahydromethanopterin reductase-like flavin-dependent oxidoreductase (luciferase family)
MGYGHMRFGLSLPMQYPMGDDLPQRFSELLETVRLARQAGFHHVSASQHYLAAPFQYMQPLPVLARVAAEAGEMTLGTGIMLLALQQPVDVAESIATLDVICGGRLVFGVGLGYRDVEFDAFGIPRGQRLSRFLEALELVKRLWTQESVTFHGRHFHLEDVRLTMRPVQKPRPPIVVAASNDKMVARVAEIGDAWTIAGHATLATLERQVALYRAALEAQGKPFPPPRFALGKELYIARDTETALREALPYIATKYEAYAQWGQDSVLPSGETFQLPIEQLRQDRFIVGDPAYCTEQIALHQKRLGIQQMGFRLHWPGLPHQRVLHAIELLGERVLPHFV